MKNQYRLLLLSVVLLTSLAPHMTDVIGITESDRNLSINLLEEEEFRPNWYELDTINAPTNRSQSALVYDSINKKSILFGGYAHNVPPYGDLNDTWAFDFETKTWTEMNPSGTVPISDGPVMVFDPISEQAIMIPNDGAVEICGTYAYSYANNTWTNLNPTNQPLCGNNHQRTMVYDNINNVIIYTYGSGNTYAYNSTSNTWTGLAGGNPCGLDGSFYTFDQKYEKMIVYDGNKATCSYDYKTEDWNDFIDKTDFNDKPIGYSYGSGMIYDPILNQSILFEGGVNSIYRNNTYSFDYEDKTWTKIITDNAPSARNRVSITYDSDQEMVILFGGRYDNADLGETWSFTPHEIINPYQVENLPENIEYNLGTADNIVFNITTSNATTYDILLNNEFINSYDYLDNDTITLDLNSIYSNYTFVNNDTNYEFSNLTLVFRNAQNDTYTVSINVLVFIILTTTETETEFSNSTDTETVTTTTNQVSTITSGNGNNTITEVSTLISTIINTVSENNGNSTNTLTENNNTPDLTSAFSNPNWLILVAAVGAAEIIRRRVS